MARLPRGAPIPSAPLRSVAGRCTTAPGHSPTARRTLRRSSRALSACPRVTAAVLARRGYRRPRRRAPLFLEGEQPPHDPFLLGDMEAACERIRAAIAAGKRICVHGDYDVDGIAATALAVSPPARARRRRRLAPPEPFRRGLRRQPRHARTARRRRVRARPHGRLRDHCGGGGRRSRRTRSRRDRHRSSSPAETLPDCPIVATRPSDYPFPELCGTGVVYKLGQALFGVDSDIPKRHLDLVALATIADVVPLVDENRSLAIAGYGRSRERRNPGSARSCASPASIRRVSTRVQSVSGLRRVSMLPAGSVIRVRARGSSSPRTRSEARRLADSLEELNKERQAVEARIVREAIARVEAWPPEQRARRAYAVAGADWHEGVIGIVASRLVERYNRPVVLIAGSGDERDWKGSGRSIPAFDLHGALGVLGPARPLGRSSRRRGCRSSPRTSTPSRRLRTARRRRTRRVRPRARHAHRRGRRA